MGRPGGLRAPSKADVMTLGRSVGISAILAAFVLVVIWNALAHQLPARYDPTVFTPAHGFAEPPFRLGDSPSGSFLIVVPVEGVMAFTTPSNYLGLYDSGGELKDEARLGAFPVELVSWDSDSVVLRSSALNQAPADREYVSTAVSRAPHHLGPYRLEVLVD